MTTLQIPRPARASGGQHPAPSRLGPALWLGAAAVVFFLVPWIGADRVGLQPDMFYLAYFTVAVAFFAIFARGYAAALGELWRTRRLLSLAIGAAAGAVMLIPLFRQDGTPHPDGWRYGFELVWRGLVYGTVDALTLFVFPAAVAYLLMRGNRNGARRRAGFAGLAVLLSMLVTTSYHLGYSEYRDETMRFPAMGVLVANVPTAITGNPLGAVTAHATMHVGAVVHQRDGGEAHMLPPRVTPDYANHGSSDVAAGLAAGWLLATAAALTLVRRTRRPPLRQEGA